MSNLTDQLQAADSNAGLIADQIAPIKADGSNDDARAALKTRIVRDLVGSVDWEKYEKLYEDIKREKVQDEIANPPAPEGDPYSGEMY